MVVVYIGQAGARKNGEGILNRLQEHKRNPEKDYWTEAVVFTTSNNSFGPTEISYLENRFCNLAIAANRYEVKNGNAPTSGNITEEKESELEEFIDFAKLIMGTLGHKVFVPLSQVQSSKELPVDGVETDEGIRFYLTRTVKQYGITVNAMAKQTSDGFVVLRGSSISPQDDSTVSAGIRERRKSAQVDENYVLLEDVLLASPSGAAMFVIGKSANGWTSWKTQDGKTLHDLENGQ